ncbi:uncharacterized protein ACA1_033410 [Acanthamoeba castellanii str. Neff]|uniref:Uncharacterized protein n=1 Tax=Acanthamoeba castellanii (strain ATCC 30010 / Neff) TaxID=1257118 RepID=L8GHH3_ACACF|nr:uncharacterized protein ACA1_033410 [Acanthamoeba castellanii str. Neff]ELR12193.1 hypothetical protein ACA1_033410 [Acanthamoeba castellanii str. Neff]
MEQALTQAHDARGGYHLHDSSEERFLLTLLLLFVSWHLNYGRDRAYCEYYGSGGSRIPWHGPHRCSSSWRREHDDDAVGRMESLQHKCECCCSRRDRRLRNASLCQGGRGRSHRKDPPQETWKSGGGGLSGHLPCLPHGFLHHRPSVRSPNVYCPLSLSPPSPSYNPHRCNDRYRIDGGQSLWGDLLNPHAMARL